MPATARAPLPAFHRTKVYPAVAVIHPRLRDDSNVPRTWPIIGPIAEKGSPDRGDESHRCCLPAGPPRRIKKIADGDFRPCVNISCPRDSTRLVNSYYACHVICARRLCADVVLCRPKYGDNSSRQHVAIDIAGQYASMKLARVLTRIFVGRACTWLDKEAKLNIDVYKYA